MASGWHPSRRELEIAQALEIGPYEWPAWLEHQYVTVGLSLGDIAAKLAVEADIEVSRPMIANCLERLGIPRRQNVPGPGRPPRKRVA